MRSQSRLRPDVRYPDIGRGRPVETRSVQRYTSAEARAHEDQLLAGARREGLVVRPPSRPGSVVGNGSSAKSRRTRSAILGAMCRPMTAVEISEATGLSDCAVRKNLRALENEGRVRVHSKTRTGKHRVTHWEAA